MTKKISITSNFDGTELMPVYIWKKTEDPISPSSIQNSVIEVTYIDKDQTYIMSVVSDGAANPTTNIIGSTQSLKTGFSLPPYTDTVFENSYMFQWQMSTNNSNWYDIIGANNSTYAVSYNPNINNKVDPDIPGSIIADIVIIPTTKQSARSKLTYLFFVFI